MSETAEQPTAKKTVAQGAGLAVVVLLAVVVIALSFRSPPKIALATAGAPPTAATGGTPSEFESQALSGLRREVEAPRNPGVPSGATAPGAATADSNNEKFFAALAQQVAAGSGPSTGGIGYSNLPPGSPAPVDPSVLAAVESRLSPLQGAIQTNPSAVTQVANALNGAAGTPDASGSHLVAGTVIEATTAQAINSDYPGAPWLGVVIRPVYFADGRVAIPAGTQIVGTASASSGPNQVLQSRLQLVCDRLVRPDGTEIALNAPVLDAAGVGAVPGATNHHVAAQAAGVLAYALIGAASTSSASSQPYSTASALNQQAVQGAGQQVAPLANKYLTVQPTVVTPPGTPLRIVLTGSLPVPVPKDA